MARIGAKLSFGPSGNPARSFPREVTDYLAKGVTEAIKAATEGLKNDERAQLRAAFGPRLAGIIGSKVYPVGKASMGAAGYVFPRGKQAENIVVDFNEAPVIMAPGKMLAIATKDAYLGGRGGHRPTPREFTARTGITLRAVKSRRPGVSLLIGERKGQPRTGKMTVYFVLLPAARQGRRLDFDSLARKWADLLPSLIDQATEGFR